LHWWLLRAHAESDAEFNKVKEDLSLQLEQGKKEIWEAHEQVVGILNKDSAGDDENILMETEHGNEQTESSKPAASTTSKLESSAFINVNNKKNNTIRVDIIAGQYVGQSYDLKPQSRNHCWVGRSQGKKFREKGISLAQDLEVSTSHGRFEYSRGKFYFMDAASTNGSRIQDLEIDPNVPIEIHTGMEITVGQTIMRVTLMAT
jgi:hypothetical protein